MTLAPKRYDLDVNPLTGFDQALQANFQIAAVQVDNTSGSWLNLGGRLIPPHFIGWSISLRPTMLSINIHTTGAPDGGAPSVLDGGPVGVVCYPEPIIEQAGAGYDLQPTINALAAAIEALQEAIVGPQASSLDDIENTLTDLYHSVEDEANPTLDNIQGLLSDLTAIVGRINTGSHSIVVVDSAATTTIATPVGGDRWYILENPSDTITCYFGFTTPLTAGDAGANISLMPREKVMLYQKSGRSLYGRVSAGTLDIKVTMLT